MRGHKPEPREPLQNIETARRELEWRFESLLRSGNAGEDAIALLVGEGLLELLLKEREAAFGTGKVTCPGNFGPSIT